MQYSGVGYNRKQNWDFPQIKGSSAYFLSSQHQEQGTVTNLEYNQWKQEG